MLVQKICPDMLFCPVWRFKMDHRCLGSYISDQKSLVIPLPACRKDHKPYVSCLLAGVPPLNNHKKTAHVNDWLSNNVCTYIRPVRSLDIEQLLAPSCHQWGLLQVMSITATAPQELSDAGGGWRYPGLIQWPPTSGAKAAKGQQI